MEVSNYLQQRREQKLGIRKTDQQERAEKKPVPVKKVSEKREVENKEYQKVSKRYLAKNPGCEAHVSSGCLMLSSEIHHKRKRNSKDDRINEANFLAVCRPCHLWIESHPIQAKELGLSESILKSK